MTGCTRRVLAVKFHLFPQRSLSPIRVNRCKIRNVRRWWRWRHAEKIFKDPEATNDRRGSVRIRCHHQNAALSEKTSADSVRERHALESLSVNVWNSVMPCQPFIDKGVVRGDQFQ